MPKIIRKNTCTAAEKILSELRRTEAAIRSDIWKLNQKLDRLTGQIADTVERQSPRDS
ncbi:MAG: hypothetical protein TR69_WS6001001463 [candidate division WS6 bacterium OLB20]|uniref:Uncharacterized protein n=1 Tax=candidate division WS6 bacterium OLB20 TaxID=1617426 RepID=A0A136LW70_9BACT|nr:MAG: hypothetical protein TR69_WS6001001463 [candidate division WS6 bacterium OLB20]